MINVVTIYNYYNNLITTVEEQNNSGTTAFLWIQIVLMAIPFGYVFLRTLSILVFPRASKRLSQYIKQANKWSESFSFLQTIDELEASADERTSSSSVLYTKMD